MKRRVLAAVDDLFFKAKIRGTAEQLGVEVGFHRDLDKLIDAAKQSEPAAIIFDLEAASIDPAAAAERLKADATTRALPLFGFYSHVHTELQKRARDAGIDHVLPRSVFNQRLLEILGESKRDEGGGMRDE